MSFRKLLIAGSALALIASPTIAEEAAKVEAAAETEVADIVDTAVAAGSFTTLVAAVQAAGLEETLRSEGPFTVFAPTDDAFAALPEGTVADLLKPENLETLQGILKYHVVAGKTESSALAGQTVDVATVNGANVSIDGTDGVKVNGASVVQADIMTSNGVIHVVDAVLLPPAEEETNDDAADE